MISPSIKLLLYAVAGVSLIGCLGSAVLLFLGALDAASFKSVFLIFSIVWFAAAGTVGGVANSSDR